MADSRLLNAVTTITGDARLLLEQSFTQLDAADVGHVEVRDHRIEWLVCHAIERFTP